MTVKRNYESLTSLLTLENNKIDKSKKRRKILHSRWNVSASKVPQVPYLYPREQTSVIVSDTCPETIAKTIVQCAKSLSLIGSYDGDKSCAVLKNDLMKCCVQLYTNSDTSDEKKSVLVEIQRKDGDCVSFHNVSSAILKAAKHGTIVSDSSNHFVPTPDRSSQESSTQSRVYDDMIVRCVVEGIDSLLKKDRFDANLLGMQNLEKLTSEYSQKEIALFTSNCILREDDEYSDIRSMIISHVTQSEDLQSEQHLCLSEDQTDQFQTIAIATLANSLECLSKSNTNFFEQMPSSEEWSTTRSDGILSSLIFQMKDAHSHIRNAYLAARCVRVILQHSPEMKANALKLDAINAASISHEIGENCYFPLGCISKEIGELLK